jgi:endoglucanase
VNPNPDLLRVDGSKIINGRGEAVHLRGFCLGGWLNMESFITGFPGHESGMRAAVADVLGEGRARFFFERFLHHFVTERDLRFLKDLGCNVIRVPFNYRHFERDDLPFEYEAEGFAPLDRVIGWARALELYVILDLHAVQGWQNRGWHCDNPGREAHFWGQRGFEDRAVALWEEMARRYRDEMFVAGYNVMNEPDADEAGWLNRFYRRVTAAIRAIDPDHILFLEGNHCAQKLEDLEPPFDDNTVYSSHNYVVPGLDHGEYPGLFDGEAYDRARLERDYRECAAFVGRHDVPNWVGEFGCIYTGGPLDDSRLRVMDDMVGIIEGQGHHWTVWTYKDIGMMGLVTAHPESEWMRRTRRIREVKSTLRCDYWIERQDTELDRLFQGIIARTTAAVDGLPGDWEGMAEGLDMAVRQGVFSQLLVPAFAESFRGMTETEIDRMMQSFAFENCLKREGLVQRVESWLLEGRGVGR